MYDPKIGRWLSADPIGFEAGDGNLYRYAGNSPTNLTDLSGLKTLEHSGDFEFGKDKRTIRISVWSDVEYDGPGWIELRLSQGMRPLDAEFHWLQFVYTIRRKGKNIVPGGRLLTAGGQYVPYADKVKGYEGDAKIVDTTSKEEIFYDKAGEYGLNSKGDLSIFDRPKVDEITEPELKAEDFSEIRSIFDSFVVEGERVYYHVHWERVGYYDGEDWKKTYENISGERVKGGRLPGNVLSKEGKLFWGYENYDKEKKEFRDPIYVQFPPKK